MSFQFLLEDGTGNYLTESGSNYLQDIPTKVINTTIQATETKNNIKTIIRSLSSNVGVTESSNKFTGLVKVATQFLVSLEGVLNKKVTFDVYTLEDGSGSYLTEDGVLYKQDIPTKVINSIIGLVGTQNRLRNFFKNVSSTIGLTEAKEKTTGFIYNVTQKIVNLQTSLIKKVRDANIYDLESGLGSYLLEDDTGFYLIDNLQIIRNISSTLGLSSLRNQIDGTVHTFVTTIGITESFNRLRDIVRIFNETLDTTESMIRARIMFRNLSDTIGVTETFNRTRIMFRNISSTIGITETFNRLRNQVRNIGETINLTESSLKYRGLLEYISDTVGINAIASRLKLITLGYNLGNFITTSLISLNNFITISLEDIDDMTKLTSYNSGDFIVNDDE